MKKLKCKFCGCIDAYISLEEKRYKVICPRCQDERYLKEYSQKLEINAQKEKTQKTSIISKQENLIKTAQF
jgi:uncharacterized Zn finger protein (UPF0148 family)